MKKILIILLAVFQVAFLHAQTGNQMEVNYDQTWSNADVQKLVTAIEASPFPRKQLEVIRSAVDTSNLGFTAEQTVSLLKNFTTSRNMADAVQILDDHILGMRAADVSKVLEVMKFPDHQLRALEVLRFTITDEANKFNVVDIFPTQKHKDQARKILKALKYPRSYIYGTIRSKSFTFVVDVSGSMATEFVTNQGQSMQRIDFVRRELKKVLTGMDHRQKFNIIFFSSDVNHWKRSMVEATPTFRQNALDFVNEMSPQGATNIYDAVKFAFKDPGLRTLYLLTDGMPTMGEKIDPRDIRKDLNDWNSSKNVKIHTTAFLTGGENNSEQRRAKRFMRRIARQNDGIFRAID